jgi:hypothetical protein
MIAAGLFAYAVLWLISLRTQDRSVDGNAYHIPPIAYWAGRGYVHWTAGYPIFDGLLNGYPKGVETLGFALVYPTRRSAVLHTLNLTFLPLGVLGVAAVGRRLGASRLLALAVGLLWIVVPVNVFQSMTSYVDSAYGSAAIAVLAIMAAGRAEVGRFIDGATRMPVELCVGAGAAGGLALGAKSTALLLTALAGLCWFGPPALRLVRHRGERRRRAGRLLAALALTGAVAGSVGGFWYARNWVVQGSPIYPVGVRIAGREIFPGLTVEDAIGVSYNTPPVMRTMSPIGRIALAWTQHFHEWPEIVFGYDSREGGLGYLWLLGGLPAVVAAALSRRRESREVLLPLIAVGALAFLGTPMSWWARYTVWLHGLGLPCLAWVAHCILRPAAGVPKSLRVAALTWLLSCLAVAAHEGQIVMRASARGAHPMPLPKRLVDWLDVNRWRPALNFLFSEARGTVFDEVLAHRGRVAIGPMDGDSAGRPKHNVLGALSIPIGRHELVALPADARELEAAHLDYAVLDVNAPLPDYLRHSAARIVDTPPFRVIVYKQR